MANYKLSEEDEAMAREQFVRANQAYLRQHTRNGKLSDLAHDVDVYLIRASQTLEMGLGSPYARLRLLEALKATGVWPDQVTPSDSLEPTGLDRWWPKHFEELPPYRPLAPRDPRPAQTTTQQEDSHGQDPDPAA